MGKREIFEEIDYLIDILGYETNRVFENSETYEKIIDSILDKILELRELLKDFD